MRTIGRFGLSLSRWQISSLVSLTEKRSKVGMPSGKILLSGTSYSSHSLRFIWGSARTKASIFGDM